MGLTKAEFRYLTGASDACPESMKETRPKVYAEYLEKKKAPIKGYGNEHVLDPKPVTVVEVDKVIEG